MHRFVSAAEAAALLGVTRETARYYASIGRIPAVRTSAGWVLDADAVMKEATMRRQYGQISRQEAARMLANFPESRRGAVEPALRALTGGTDPIRAAGAPGQPGGEEFGRLYAPATRAEARERRRQAIAAAAPPPGEDDDDYPDYARLFPDSRDRP
jgi:hypothetical protein